MWINPFGIIYKEKKTNLSREIDNIADKALVLNTIIEIWNTTGWYINMDTLISISNNLIIAGNKEETKEIQAVASHIKYKMKEQVRKNKNKQINNGQLTLNFD